MTELIMKVYDVLDELTTLEIFNSMKKLNRLIEKKYEEEIKKFQIAKKAYNEIMNDGGKYHPDYKNVANELSINKKNLYDKEELVEYRKLEVEYENILNDFLNEVITIISPHIKRKDDFFKGGTCHVR